MAIKVLSLKDEDFTTMQHCILSKDGDFTTPAVLRAMPVSSAEAARLRNDWNVQQQRDIFSHDPSARFMKAVDAEKDNEILAVARWHYYASGSLVSDLEYAGEKHKDDPASYPPGFNVGVYRELLGQILDERPNWTVNGPLWFLTTLKTRELMTGRGAGTALIKWGMEQAKQDGCPAYLEAGEAATSLYRSCGFKPLGVITVDLSKAGVDDKRVLQKLAYNVA